MNRFLLVPLLLLAHGGTLFAQPVVGQNDTNKILVLKPNSKSLDSCCQYVFKTTNCNSTTPYRNAENDVQTTPPELPVVAWTYNAVGCGYGYQRSFLKFNNLISSIPATATIDSVFLSLFGFSSSLTMPQGNSNFQGSGYNSFGTNEVLVERVQSPWNRTTLTWNNQPASISTNSVLIPKSNKQYNYDVTINVTGMVKDMFAAGVSNGFILKQQIEVYYRSMGFYSCYATDTTKIPYLTIYYRTKGTTTGGGDNGEGSNGGGTTTGSGGVTNITPSSFHNYNLSIYPVPATSDLTISFETKSLSVMEYSITDMSGRRISHTSFKPLLGYNTIQIPLRDLAQGSYILYITDGLNSSRKHFSKL